MKRKTVGKAKVSKPAKRSRIEDLNQSSFTQEPASSDDDTDYSGSESQTATTQASSQTSPSPRPKYPSELKTLKCTYEGCDKLFNRPARLEAHYRSHTDERPFKCTYDGCNKTYREDKHLVQHVKGSHSKVKNHPCTVPGCVKSFTTGTRLRRHQQVHEKQEQFKCRGYPPCNKSFRKHQTLERHIRTEHLLVSPFQCTYTDPETGVACDGKFDTAASLKRHQERKHGELRFWCEECRHHPINDGDPMPTGFSTAWLLENHIKNDHVNCMFCGLSLRGKAKLEEHIDDKHFKESLEERKNITCTWEGCNKTFTKKSNLTTHIRTAHEEQRHICGEVDLSGTADLATWDRTQGCGEGFTTKASLENHVRYLHLGLPRPQTASMASRSNQESGLPLLQELTGVGHKARRTVTCIIPGCTQKFFHISEREAHVQSHHGVEQALLTTLGTGPMFSDATPAYDYQPPFLGGWDQVPPQLPQQGLQMMMAGNEQTGGFWDGEDIGPWQQPQQEQQMTAVGVAQQWQPGADKDAYQWHPGADRDGPETSLEEAVLIDPALG